MQTIAYIRPTRSSERSRQLALVEPYKPTLIWQFPEYEPDDIIKMMSRPGRELVVPTLDTIAPRVADRNRVIDAVLKAGSYVIDAASGERFEPEQRSTIMVALGAKRRSLSTADARRAGRAGGKRGYLVKELEDCLPAWTDANLTSREITAQTGVHYSTLWRYFQRDRAVKVPRPRGPGRPHKQA